MRPPVHAAFVLRKTLAEAWHCADAKWFRANITMIASVTPDPGVDFPEAVELMEAGRFEAGPIYTHVMSLEDVQKAFEMSANYTDGVIKMCAPPRLATPLASAPHY